MWLANFRFDGNLAFRLLAKKVLAEIAIFWGGWAMTAGFARVSALANFMCMLAYQLSLCLTCYWFCWGGSCQVFSVHFGMND